jgi:hypothetical protein
MLTTPPIFAAGLFDGPWLIIAIAIISALANWLSKRRQQKEADRESPPATAPATEEKKATDWEKALRQLLGEEETPPQPSAPPPIPPVRRPPPPPLIQTGEEESEPVVITLPPLRTPPIVSRPPVVVAPVMRESIPVGPRVSTPTPVQPAMTVSDFTRTRRARGRRVNVPWRNPRYAREASVASLVFGPPKGLES